jgi:hypothetical protein
MRDKIIIGFLGKGKNVIAPGYCIYTPGSNFNYDFTPRFQCVTDHTTPTTEASNGSDAAGGKNTEDGQKASTKEANPTVCE